MSFNWDTRTWADKEEALKVLIKQEPNLPPAVLSQCLDKYIWIDKMKKRDQVRIWNQYQDQKQKMLKEQDEENVNKS